MSPFNMIPDSEVFRRFFYIVQYSLSYSVLLLVIDDVSQYTFLEFQFVKASHKEYPRDISIPGISLTHLHKSSILLVLLTRDLSHSQTAAPLFLLCILRTMFPFEEHLSSLQVRQHTPLILVSFLSHSVSFPSCRL